MPAESALLVRSFVVGRRTCTLTIPRPRVGEAIAMACEWSPDNPTSFSDREWEQYRAGRNAALAELGEILGSKIAVVEIG